MNVRSSWRGSRLNVHTIPMKHRLSQLPGRRMRLLQNSVQSADFCNYQRYNGAYHDLYRKSRIRAARKKRRTMDDDLRIPYSSSERTMKGREKKTQQKELTNVIPDHRLIGMCVSVRMVRPSPRSPERQSPVPAAGRFPGLRIITKGRLPGCKVQ